MQLRHAAAAATPLLFLTLLLLPSATNAVFNITAILDNHPEFSTFNHYLTVTLLAPEISRTGTSVTILAVDNAAMADLLAKHLSLRSIKRILALHILLDYYGAKEIHQLHGDSIISTIYMTIPDPAISGEVRIMDYWNSDEVGFVPDDNADRVGVDVVAATFVKAFEAMPYNYSVIQISSVLPSPETPPPNEFNLTAALSAHGCKAFADALLATAADQTLESRVESGLTVFCPGDDAMKSFMPKYENLSAGGKQSLLEYHAMPVYESLSGLQSSNGPEKNTLATDGAKLFSLTVQNDGNDVTIKSPIVTAKIVSTVIDKEPVAIFQLDKVLMPKELFKSSLPPRRNRQMDPTDAN